MKNNEDRGYREKKKEKLDGSISNQEVGFLNVFRFTAFTILVTFKSFVRCSKTLYRIQKKETVPECFF